MKIRTYTSLGLFFLLAGMTLSRGRAQLGVEKTNEKSIDDYITSQMTSGRFPGIALSIVKGDQVVYMKGYGHADPSGRPVTPQTSFIIGSITKPFTTTALLQLVDAGKVDLDSPVQRYLPWFHVADPQASARITVRMLVNQTSGLPQNPTFVTWAWPDYPDALERHVRLMADAKLIAPPGKSFFYSNINAVIMGLIVQVVSGQSYEDYIRQNIFTPLDMQHSFVSQDEAIRHGMAAGYRWWFGFPFPVTIPYNRANLPAGFIISSAEDMAHFLIAQLNGGRYRGAALLSPEMIALMQAEPAPGVFPMGWEFTRLNGRPVVHFEGGPANFQASLYFDPESKVGVFVAANVINALDTLSGARTKSLLDGISTRSMAASVMSLATDQPLPEQGIGIRRLSLLFDLVILALTGLQVVSFARIPRQYRRLERRGVKNTADLYRRSAGTSALHFIPPLGLLAAALKLPNWIILTLLQPDLIYWLYAMAALTSLKGLIEIGMVWRVFRRAPKGKSHG